jgi:hypothetical protein
MADPAAGSAHWGFAVARDAVCNPYTPKRQPLFGAFFKYLQQSF